jgi:3alpha(or 20beta)-hydroxysteroid dehydrogenase
MTRIHGGDDAMAWGGSKVALKRVGTPEDVAGLYVFLASDESAYCTGSEFVCDGGATATHAYGG